MFTSFSAWALDFLSKAAGHKYIRRIPYTSGGKLRYRYIYKVTHTAGGKHALHEDDVTVGAAFMLGTDKGSEVHAHVKSVDGDKVTVEYDDGPRKGEKETMSKRDLLSKLDAAHGISAALQSEREKQAKVVSELRASGASEKQIAREQARLDRLGVEAREPEAEKPAPKKRAPKAPKKPKSAESAESASQIDTTSPVRLEDLTPSDLRMLRSIVRTKGNHRPIIVKDSVLYATDGHRAVRIPIAGGADGAYTMPDIKTLAPMDTSRNWVDNAWIKPLEASLLLPARRYKDVVTLDNATRADLLRVASTISKQKDERGLPLPIEVSASATDGKLKISVPSTGETIASLPYAADKDMSLRVASDYLKDALGAEGAVTIRFTGEPRQPLLLTSEHMEYLLMPRRH
jgi:hypothetical protein